ncbi:MAG: hypothetical protein M1828_007057 [Chrysothrix sp. TS-e1954]|nr:MAG: hypothetical protein M1828_007057 [Chrysothrix sp. TS-e1954]
MAAHYKDLREVYAKKMEFHGNGFALYQPIAAQDMQPPCCGFFDRNGDWNLICNLVTNADPENPDQPVHHPPLPPSTKDADGQDQTQRSPDRSRGMDEDSIYHPLAYMPQKTTDINIVWQPKTSSGMEAICMDASGQTPYVPLTLPFVVVHRILTYLPQIVARRVAADIAALKDKDNAKDPDRQNLAVGADAHIKYTNREKFGAVLMTHKPITLTAYNAERLFCAWIASNKSLLYARHGPELRKYGCVVVTRTYTAPRCSINAWMDTNKAAVVSMKMKASMLGELGEELSWEDKLTDKGWCHYSNQGKGGVVVFVDGIDVSKLEWRKEGVLQAVFGGPAGRQAARERQSTDLMERERRAQAIEDAPVPKHRFQNLHSQYQSVKMDAGEPRRPSHSRSPAAPLGRKKDPMAIHDHDRQVTWLVDGEEIDEDVLKDVGMRNSFNSAIGSMRSSSTAGRRTPSLRRESRHVSRETETPPPPSQSGYDPRRKIS